MPVNETKCHVISFGSQIYRPGYKLGGIALKWTDSTKYLGITLCSNLKFEQHLHNKQEKASMVLGAIKHILHDAPKKAQLLAYTSLCRPILEYADTVWDPTQRNQIDAIESIQNRAVRFICKLKGRESTSTAREELGLQTLENRRRDHRLSLLMKILGDEDCHQDLASAYDEIVQNNSQMSMTTRSAARGELTSIYMLPPKYIIMTVSYPGLL